MLKGQCNDSHCYNSLKFLKGHCLTNSFYDNYYVLFLTDVPKRPVG